MRRLDAVEQPDGEMLYKMAQAYAMLGDGAAAVRHLRRAVQQEFVCYRYFTSDPLLESARNEPGFAAVLETAWQRSEAYRRKFF